MGILEDADLGIVQAERLLHLAHFGLYALQALSRAHPLPCVRAARYPMAVSQVHNGIMQPLHLRHDPSHFTSMQLSTECQASERLCCYYQCIIARSPSCSGDSLRRSCLRALCFILCWVKGCVRGAGLCLCLRLASASARLPGGARALGGLACDAGTSKPG